MANGRITASDLMKAAEETGAMFNEFLNGPMLEKVTAFYEMQGRARSQGIGDMAMIDATNQLSSMMEAASKEYTDATGRVADEIMSGKRK